MRADTLDTSADLIQHTQDKYHDAVLNICYPLFKKTPINYFDYLRYYDSGELITCSTCPDFMTSACTKFLYPSFDELQDFISSNLKCAFLTRSMKLPPGLDPEKFQENLTLATDNRIFVRIFFVERHTDYFVTCGFGVMQENKSTSNFYLNLLPILESFVKYFEYHAEELLSEYSQYYRIIMPHYYDKSRRITQRDESAFDFSTVDFSIDHQNTASQDNILITTREMDCLALISKGYTMKNAARKLEISPRTVEQHLRNIKEKHGLNSKNQLVEIWHDLYSKKKGEKVVNF